MSNLTTIDPVTGGLYIESGRSTGFYATPSSFNLMVRYHYVLPLLWSLNLPFPAPSCVFNYYTQEQLDVIVRAVEDEIRYVHNKLHYTTDKLPLRDQLIVSSIVSAVGSLPKHKFIKFMKNTFRTIAESDGIKIKQSGGGNNDDSEESVIDFLSHIQDTPDSMKGGSQSFHMRGGGILTEVDKVLLYGYLTDQNGEQAEQNIINFFKRRDDSIVDFNQWYSTLDKEDLDKYFRTGKDTLEAKIRKESESYKTILAKYSDIITMFTSPGEAKGSRCGYFMSSTDFLKFLEMSNTFDVSVDEVNSILNFCILEEETTIPEGYIKQTSKMFKKNGSEETKESKENNEPEDTMGTKEPKKKGNQKVYVVFKNSKGDIIDKGKTKGSELIKNNKGTAIYAIAVSSIYNEMSHRTDVQHLKEINTDDIRDKLISSNAVQLFANALCDTESNNERITAILKKMIRKITNKVFDQAFTEKIKLDVYMKEFEKFQLAIIQELEAAGGTGLGAFGTAPYLAYSTLGFRSEKRKDLEEKLKKVRENIYSLLLTNKLIPAENINKDEFLNIKKDTYFTSLNSKIENQRGSFLLYNTIKTTNLKPEVKRRYEELINQHKLISKALYGFIVFETKLSANFYNHSFIGLLYIAGASYEIYEGGPGAKYVIRQVQTFYNSHPSINAAGYPTRLAPGIPLEKIQINGRNYHVQEHPSGIVFFDKSTSTRINRPANLSDESIRMSLVSARAAAAATAATHTASAPKPTDQTLGGDKYKAHVKPTQTYRVTGELRFKGEVKEVTTDTSTFLFTSKETVRTLVQPDVETALLSGQDPLNVEKVLIPVTTLGPNEEAVYDPKYGAKIVRMKECQTGQDLHEGVCQPNTLAVTFGERMERRYLKNPSVFSGDVVPVPGFLGGTRAAFDIPCYRVNMGSAVIGAGQGDTIAQKLVANCLAYEAETLGTSSRETLTNYLGAISNGLHSASDLADTILSQVSQGALARADSFFYMAQIGGVKAYPLGVGLSAILFASATYGRYSARDTYINHLGKFNDLFGIKYFEMVNLLDEMNREFIDCMDEYLVELIQDDFTRLVSSFFNNLVEDKDDPERGRRKGQLTTTGYDELVPYVNRVKLKQHMEAKAKREEEEVKAAEREGRSPETISFTDEELFEIFEPWVRKSFNDAQALIPGSKDTKLKNIAMRRAENTKVEHVSIKLFKHTGELSSWLNDIKEKLKKLEEEAQSKSSFTLNPAKHFEKDPKQLFNKNEFSKRSINDIMRDVVESVTEAQGHLKYKKYFLNDTGYTKFLSEMLASAKNAKDSGLRSTYYAMAAGITATEKITKGAFNALAVTAEIGKATIKAVLEAGGNVARVLLKLGINYADYSFAISTASKIAEQQRWDTITNGLLTVGTKAVTAAATTGLATKSTEAAMGAAVLAGAEASIEAVPKALAERVKINADEKIAMYNAQRNSLNKLIGLLGEVTSNTGINRSTIEKAEREKELLLSAKNGYDSMIKAAEKARDKAEAVIQEAETTAKTALANFKAKAKARENAAAEKKKKEEAAAAEAIKQAKIKNLYAKIYAMGFDSSKANSESKRLAEVQNYLVPGALEDLQKNAIQKRLHPRNPAPATAPGTAPGTAARGKGKGKAATPSAPPKKLSNEQVSAFRTNMDTIFEGIKDRDEEIKNLKEAALRAFQENPTENLKKGQLNSLRAQAGSMRSRLGGGARRHRRVTRRANRRVNRKGRKTRKH
jgi:hypothetical protein